MPSKEARVIDNSGGLGLSHSIRTIFSLFTSLGPEALNNACVFAPRLDKFQISAFYQTVHHVLFKHYFSIRQGC